MEPRTVARIYLDALKDILSTPWIIILGFSLWGILRLLSALSVAIYQRFPTLGTVPATIIFLVFSAIVFCITSFYTAGFTGCVKERVEKKKFSFGKFLGYGAKYWARLFLALVLILLAGALSWAIAHYGGIFIGQLFHLQLEYAKVLFFLISFFGMIGGVMFLTFSSFCIVMHNESFIQGVRHSARIVRDEYLAVLAISIISFVLVPFLVSYLPPLVNEGLLIALYGPYIVLVLSRFTHVVSGTRKK